MKKLINGFLYVFGGVLGGVTAMVTLETLSVLSKEINTRRNRRRI